MIEILVLMNLCRKLSAMAAEKGRSRGWGALGALAWFGGEVIGFLIGVALDLGAGAYVVALVCAAIAMTIVWYSVKGMQPGGMVAAYASTGSSIENPNYDPKNPFSPPRVE
jgi:hypothetical protein